MPGEWWTTGNPTIVDGKPTGAQKPDFGGALKGGLMGYSMGGPIGAFAGGIGGLMNIPGFGGGGVVDRGEEFRNVDPNNYGFGGQDYNDAISGLPGLANQLGNRDMSSFRGDQQGLVQMLQAQAMGEGPGQELARLRANEQATRGFQQQLSLAASAAPGSQGLANRQAAQNQGMITQGAAQAATQGGLAAQLGAVDQLGGVLQGARGADIQETQMNDMARFQALQQAINANNAFEQHRTDRFGALHQSKQPTETRALLNMLKGGADVFGMFGGRK